MFADINATKLTTDKIKAHVFYYRGADSYQMMDKLKRDEKIQILANQKRVSKVFILTGSNNVDQICNKRQTLNDGCCSMAQTIDYVKSLFSSAAINVLNILPRTSENRQSVINQLNGFIRSFCEQDKSHQLTLVDTYATNLFTFPNGIRRPELFKFLYKHDYDNVHLNNSGVIKLGRYLKYLAHI